MTRDLAVCRHHWLLDPPSGPLDHGVCKFCGAVRDFVKQEIFSSYNTAGTDPRIREWQAQDTKVRMRVW